MNDATKQLPDFDPSVPSLTDLRILKDEYLNYKNQQDIKKICQKYIQLSSNLKHNNSASSNTQLNKN